MSYNDSALDVSPVFSCHKGWYPIVNEPLMSHSYSIHIPFIFHSYSIHIPFIFHSYSIATGILNGIILRPLQRSLDSNMRTSVTWLELEVRRVFLSVGWNTKGCWVCRFHVISHDDTINNRAIGYSISQGVFSVLISCSSIWYNVTYVTLNTFEYLGLLRWVVRISTCSISKMIHISTLSKPQLGGPS